MESFGLLTEVGIALAGFSGIAIAIGSRDGEISSLMRWRNENLLISTLGATFGSLAVPFFETSGFEGAALWRASSLTFLPIALYAFVNPPLGLRQIPTSERVRFSKTTWYLSLVLAGSAATAQLGNVLGLFGTATPGPLFAGLLGLLLAGTSQFFRILVGIAERPDA
jgi:hypothetical protein